jgi:hypothetical protein
MGKIFVAFFLNISIIFFYLSTSSPEEVSLEELIRTTREKLEEIDRIQRAEVEPAIAEPEEEFEAPYQIIRAEYLKTLTIEHFPEEEKGPDAVTILDPYHPEHKGFPFPYFKDREGLKITPFLGIRGEYYQDEELIGLESLIIEAKELRRESKEDLKRYISTNNKHYLRGEIILHHKETWPKLTYIYHAERTTRVYDGKLFWSDNNIAYDHSNINYYQLEYTLANLPRVGYLDITTRYGRERIFKPNDIPGYQTCDSWLLVLESMPFWDTKTKFELLYKDGRQPRWDQIDSWERYELYLELSKFFPHRRLTIRPYYKWEQEEQFPVAGNSRWTLHKAGLGVEKDITGKLEFEFDWAYLNYARDQNRNLATSRRISLNCLVAENTLSYEIIQDVKFSAGLDYQTGFGFSGFDNYTLRGELSYRKPGLADYRIGLRYTDYYNLNDSLDMWYFKIGLFI